MRAISGPVFYAVFLIALLCLQALLLLFPHALVVNGHEGDLLHTIDAATRLGHGEWPHTGFMTPLGILSFAPISVFMSMGFGPGTSFRLGMLLVAVVLLPVIWLVGETRLGPRLKYFYGAWLIIMVTGLVYGGDQATSSISMFYNRWAWAAVFLICVIVLVPTKTEMRRSELDGAFIGLLLGFLALTKITCFAAMLPAVLAYFVMNRDAKAAIAAGVAGLLVALMITIAAGGPQYWLAYARDLLFLAVDSSREKPGLEYASVIANPTYLPGTFCLFISVVVLRMFRWKNSGLLLLIMAPGLYYITYQNWGNDPTWLVLLATVMMALRTEAGQSSLFSIDVRSWHNGLALAALVLISPSLLNVTYSTLRSAALDRDKMTPVFWDAVDPDLLVSRERAYAASGKSPLAPVRDDKGGPGAPENPLEFAGESFGDCAAQTGLIGMYQDMARDMRDRGLQGRRILVADVVNPLWLMGAGARIPALAPWYYGGSAGIDAAELLLVPMCPYKPDSRKMMLEEVTKFGWKLEIAVRKPHYVLFRRVTP